MTTGSATSPLEPAELRSRRRRLGLTQRALGAALGVTATTVARWERGERAISTPLMVRLALDHLDAQPLTPAVEPIPAAEVALIGRTRELGAVRRLIRESGVRLVTFIGPGGAGKSVLALEAARRAAAARAAGGCLVELADLSPGAPIEGTVGRALGVRASRDGSVGDAIVRALRGTDLLLLLDNCEHVSAGVTGLVTTMLRRCPEVTVFATSRVPLRIRAEHRLVVNPLAVPDLRGHQHPASLLRVPAVTLFVERWRAVNADYRLTARDARAVAEICVRLDGLPLALELTAAAAGQTQPAELVSGPTNPDRADAAAPIDLPERHRSLDAVLDWSHRLLTPAAQQVFRRLSVFAGSFPRECALDIVGWDLDAESAQRALAQLVDASLVVQPGGGSSPRLRLLETVRSYGARRLADSGEHELTARAHARWFTEWAERGSCRFENAAQSRWLNALDFEFGNIRAALTWCLGQGGDPGVGLRLATAVRRYWDMRGLPAEGEATLVALLERDREPSSARLSALLELAGLATRREDISAVERFAQEADRIADRLGDLSSRAKAIASLTYAYYMRRDPGGAWDIASLALTYARTAGDPVAVSHARLALGVAALGRGMLPEALAQFTETCDEARSRGDLWLLSETNDVLASTLIALRDFRPARAAGLESLLARLELGNRPLVPVNLRMIGIADAELNAPERSAVLFGAAVALERSLGALPHTQWAEDYRRALEGTRIALGEQRFGQLWNAGVQASDAEIRLVASGSPSTLIGEPPLETDGRRDPLTPRELEVARLVGQGMTSREIAERLAISVRTAASHTEHIMIKLDVHSRVQVATWVERSHSAPTVASRHG